MAEKALLVVDMLNDFIRKNGALDCGESAREIIPFVRSKINEFHQNKDLVVFICDSHEKNDVEFELFPPHCVKGTEGAEIIKELPVGEYDPIVYKSRYSAFYNTDLAGILKKNNVKKVYVTGVCTSICVMDTVGDLRNRDYPVFVYEKGVADFDPEAHQFSLKRMKKIYGAQII